MKIQYDLMEEYYNTCVYVCVQDRSTFRRIVLKNAFNRRKMYEALLESVPMLTTLDVSISVCLSVCLSVTLDVCIS